MAERPFTFAGGVFRARHDARVATPIDFTTLDLARYPQDVLAHARRVWSERARSEFRSIQIMARFLEEVLGAGDPLDVYACAADLVEDEIRHTSLCVAVCEALGAPATMPLPLPLDDDAEFRAAPMAERALATAISMLLVNETLSTGYLEDLRARAAEPSIRAALDAIVADEDTHRGFGEAYVRSSLERFPREMRAHWRRLADASLAPQRTMATRTRDRLTPDQRDLAAWPDDALAPLGLFSPERQALVYFETYERRLAPCLRALELC